MTNVRLERLKDQRARAREGLRKPGPHQRSCREENNEITLEIIEEMLLILMEKKDE